MLKRKSFPSVGQYYVDIQSFESLALQSMKEEVRWLYFDDFEVASNVNVVLQDTALVDKTFFQIKHGLLGFSYYL